jgi:hypothetical protein
MSDHDHGHAHAHADHETPRGGWRARLTERLVMLSGWTWVAAGSLIGFEALEMVLGASLAAPEFIPLVVIGLGLAWFLRERIRAAARRLRIRVRARRARRADLARRPADRLP